MKTSPEVLTVTFVKRVLIYVCSLLFLFFQVFLFFTIITADTAAVTVTAEVIISNWLRNSASNDCWEEVGFGLGEVDRADGIPKAITLLSTPKYITPSMMAGDDTVLPPIL